MTQGLPSISLADDALMQNLLWLLISRGVLPREDVSQMIGGCIEQLSSAPTPNTQAIRHLEQIQANIDRAGRPDQ